VALSLVQQVTIYDLTVWQCATKHAHQEAPLFALLLIFQLPSTSYGHLNQG